MCLNINGVILSFLIHIYIHIVPVYTYMHLMHTCIHTYIHSARIQFKILFLTCKAFLGQTPLYLCDLIRRPISATSGRPLRSLDHHDLLVPRSRTSTAQHRAYASVGPLLWNEIPAITRALMLYGGTSVSARSPKTFLFSRGLRTGSASD